jgi:Mg-chelatase subunit ChlD
MSYTATDYTTGFTVNMTNKVALPDVDYINELAIEKNFSLSSSFSSPPKLLEDLYSLLRKENEDDEFSLDKYLFSTEYLEEDVLFRPLTTEERAYYNSTLLFLEKIDFTNVIGITPMDKALNIMMYLVQLSTKTNPPKNYREDSMNDPAGENIEITPESLQQAIDEMGQEGMQNATDNVAPPDETKPGGGRGNGGGNSNDDSLSDDITKCVRDHLSDITPSIAHVYGAKKPSDVPINRRILNDIRIKSYLENSQGLETAKDAKKKRNNDTDQRDRLRMEEHSQITKVRKSAMMMDHFDEKHMKKELDVKEKMKPDEKKQALYMLLDDSGSMRCKVKQTYVRAVLLNRLESVIEGKSELKFSLYESERYDDTEVKDMTQAQELYKKICLRRPSGGGTYIGNVLQQTIDEIHDMENYHDPEIMIVCDGDDYVDPKSLKYKNVRINVVLLGTKNDGLKQIAKDTGGFYTEEKLYDRN